MSAHGIYCTTARSPPGRLGIGALIATPPHRCQAWQGGAASGAKFYLLKARTAHRKGQAMDNRVNTKVLMIGAWAALLYPVLLILGWWCLAGFVPPIAPTATASELA